MCDHVVASHRALEIISTLVQSLYSDPRYKGPQELLHLCKADGQGKDIRVYAILRDARKEKPLQLVRKQGLHLHHFEVSDPGAVR